MRELILTVEKYEEYLHAVSKRITRDHGISEDIVQDAFLAYYNAVKSGTQVGNAKAYLHSAVRNKSIDHCRKRDRETEILDSLPKGLAIESDHSERTLERIDIDHALARLPRRLRDALLLRDRESLSYEEISVRLSIPVNTVRSRIFRARERMRGMLSSRGDKE